MADTPVRVRFAPSPTGLLHIGGLRTALYNYLFARRHGGTFVLRIEDTDQTRFVAEAEADILDSLRWAGLTVDEGPGVGGPHAPYHQSQRTARYRAAADHLVAAGHAYYAFDTPEALDALRHRLEQAGDAAPTYNAASRQSMQNSFTLAADDVQRRLAAGEPHVVRLNVPHGEVLRFHDLIRGWVSFETDGLDDQVLLKSDGLPTYHLANVVDDHEMGISHVIRGEEWLPSTPKHLLLYRAFGWEPPQMAHLPLILSPSGGKLSKRNAEAMGIPVSVRQYRAAGYEPEALVNFLAFLGWNPGDDREVMDLADLTAAYSIERTGHGGAQFNLDKLNWYNAHYVRQQPTDAWAERLRPLLAAEGLLASEALLHDAIDLMRERVSFAAEVVTAGRYFFEAPATYDEAAVAKRWKAGTAAQMRAFADALAAVDPFTAETTEAALRRLAETTGVKAGDLIHPTRLAVSGVPGGPSLFPLLAALGREVCVARLRRAADVLG